MNNTERPRIRYAYEEKEYKLKNNEYYEIDEYRLSVKSIEELKERGICTINSKKDVVFKFVGVICTENVIVVLPKYYIPIDENNSYQNKDKLKATVDILNVLRRYPKDKAKQYLGEFFLNSNINDINTSEIGLADYLIKDFINNGVYENTYCELSMNTDGEIDWEYTIDNVQPYISESGVIYTDTYSYEFHDDLDNKVTAIHRLIINYCIKLYSKLLGYNISEIDSMFTSLEQIGSKEEILSIIDKELHNTFDQSKIDTLTCVYNMINKTYNKNEENNYSVFGTTSFKHIWEYVIAEVFSSEKSKYITGNKKSKYKDEDEYEVNIMDRPIWMDIDKENVINKNKKRTLDPDFIKVEDDILFVLDAKYYNIQYKYSINEDNEKELTVIENPGIEDITKQFLYKKILKKRIPEKYPEIKIEDEFNAFIYPSRQNIDTLFEKFGRVKLDIFEKDTIYNIYIDPEKLYKLYLNKEKVLCSILCCS